VAGGGIGERCACGGCRSGLRRKQEGWLQTGLGAWREQEGQEDVIDVSSRKIHGQGEAVAREEEGLGEREEREN